MIAKVAGFEICIEILVQTMGDVYDIFSENWVPQIIS